jgi:hypothetical protein
MSFGKMTILTDIVQTIRTVDADGFATQTDEVVASIRAYREDRHGSERWANRAAFSDATALFRFRKIPGLTVTTDHVLVCATDRYRIISIEDVRNRGMYYEALADKIESSIR